MQTYDFLMLFVLLGTTLFGFVKGMAWQVAYIASLVVSYLAALRFSSQLAPLFGDSEPFNRFVAMLVIYMATSLVIWMVFRGVAGVIDRVKLKEFDRQMGAMIGFARGVLWCIAITFFAATLLESYRATILGSKSGHYIAVLLDKSHTVVPQEIHAVIRPYVERIEQGLDPNRPAGLPGGTPWPGSGQGGWPQDQGGGNPALSPPANTASAPWPPQSAWPNELAPRATPWPSDSRTPAQQASDNGF